MKLKKIKTVTQLKLLHAAKQKVLHMGPKSLGYKFSLSPHITFHTKHLQKYS